MPVCGCLLPQPARQPTTVLCWPRMHTGGPYAPPAAAKACLLPQLPADPPTAVLASCAHTDPWPLLLDPAADPDVNTVASVSPAATGTLLPPALVPSAPSAACCRSLPDMLLLLLSAHLSCEWVWCESDADGLLKCDHELREAELVIIVIGVETGPVGKAGQAAVHTRRANTKQQQHTAASVPERLLVWREAAAQTFAHTQACCRQPMHTAPQACVLCCCSALCCCCVAAVVFSGVLPISGLPLHAPAQHSTASN